MDYYAPPAQQTEQISAEMFCKEADRAQYGGSDYQNAIRVERGISLQKAFEIAAADPQIHYFCFTKGYSMVLEVPSNQGGEDPLHLISQVTYRRDIDGSIGCGKCRVFHYGDVVFFSKEGKWLGTAPGLSDTYSKIE